MATETHLGKIEISPLAVASLASDAVLGCYGVVGMAPAGSLRDGLVEILQREATHRGVEVRVREHSLVVGLYVVIEYGIRISEVAQNIMEAVTFRLEHVLGMPIAEVNVHVQDLRVSNA
ncbi:MAG TPA: Asp23/Gls24 family envelope stress response protein [Anaerolineae bacterium]|nr:Asp23/Gls24 family envelope stress response protein [Anaerolineae bacterium]